MSEYTPAQSSTGTAIITEPKKDTTLSLSPLDITGVAPHKQTFTGKLTETDSGSPIAGKTIHLFINDADTGLTTTTDASGNFSIDYTFELVGTYKYYVRYLGD